MALLYSGIRNIEFSADSIKRVPDNSWDLVHIKRLATDCDFRQSIDLMVEPAEGVRFSTETSQVVIEVISTISQLFGVISPHSLVTYPLFSGTREGLVIEPVLSAGNRISDAATENAARIIMEGALPAILLARYGTTYVVYGLFEAAQIDPTALQDNSNAAYTLILQLEAAHPDRHFFLTGDIPNKSHSSAKYAAATVVLT